MTNETIFKQIAIKGPLKCWIWTGYMSPVDRYPRAGSNVRGTRQLHRIVYERLIAPVARDLVVDHLCENTLCLNPSHLEPKTVWENTKRSRTNPVAKLARRKRCKLGHAYSINRRTKKRYCKRCASSYSLKWYYNGGKEKRHARSSS